MHPTHTKNAGWSEFPNGKKFAPFCNACQEDWPCSTVRTGTRDVVLNQAPPIETCDSCVGLGYCPDCEAKWSALSCPHGCPICGSMGSHMEQGGDES